MAKLRRARARTIVGWREWVGFPGLDVPLIKAKLDTGAKTSALHTFHTCEIDKGGERWVHFGIHPFQGLDEPEILCEARVSDEREVMSSNGVREKRLFIETTLEMGPSRFAIELSLTNRDQMGFRLLIGRSALKRRFVVDPGRSFLLGRPDGIEA